MKITFLGHGYVGLVTATVFADLGNTVHVIGHTKDKIDNLNKGIIPIYEPGLSEVVQRNIKSKRLFFTLDYSPYIQESDIVFIAVGTPPKKNGEADLTTVFEVAEKIGKNLSGFTVVATKSTVPVGTNKKVKEIISKTKPEKAEFEVASVPEFLREGSAIGDTLNPDRIIIGTESKKAEALLVELHKPIDGHFVLTNLETAEMIKYASNSFLAVKISFANAIAKLSELTGADGIKVLEGVGLDKRVGKEFLQPGAGYGGSCFPKDVKALISIAKGYGYKFALLEEVEAINRNSRNDIVRKAEKLLGTFKNKKISVLGLAFKSNTDDMRDAPSIDIINMLKEKKAFVQAYDPQAMNNAKKIISGIEFCEDIHHTVQDANLLIVLTEWNEFKEIDLREVKKLMKTPLIIDGRNIYDSEKLKKMGFTYLGVGR
ncbi:MAG: UDP-glucose 6-dehydrogenase [Candidatus Levybacteria bacterium RIFCSPHIGHO2_01_FULL_36_15]|nr:MAG: UDP-glucose 6-dehydrogenase [Candidatus Levybacteria bacterium RIFCSPHIGHO2_01_FULL_36_15]OGH38409.1 MAG: UDP-glucose 6-dehydrogenase [Candidatus Levybacteria bacterium RIFCSPLOWO2_01_FULL_36_10]